MANNGSSSPSPPPMPSRRRMKTCARRCERACCTVASYFPLAFVYSLTTWAVWVDAGIGFRAEEADDRNSYSRKGPSIVGIVLYLLLNASYTTAVFTDPGSPLGATASNKRGKYSVLPTSESHNEFADVQTITVSSTGGSRYCKKCQVQKPDRAHHCSTCKRCVLKMDHHCPWLATCLGLHNYKAFLLFLIYTSLFCWACFGNSATWVYSEIFASAPSHLEEFAPVNVIMLAIISGIIGLVLTGFTAWHLYLCIRGQTTIECLEKTRYLSGVRKQVEHARQERHSHSRDDSDGIAGNLRKARDQLLEFHANAVPGASRFEEGEEHRSPTPSVDHDFRAHNHGPHQHSHVTGSQHQPQTSISTTSSSISSNFDSPAQRALRQNYGRDTYSNMESRRDHDRYEEYLSEQETSSLPNAFDLGWRRNLSHLFGPNPLLWWLPVCNTTGDGWRWEVSQRWVTAQEEVSRQKEERLRNAAMRQPQPQNSQGISYQGQLRGGAAHNRQEGYLDDHGYGAGQHDAAHYQYSNSAMSMQTLQHSRSRQMRRDFDTGEDGEVASFEVSGSEHDTSDSDSETEHRHAQTRAVLKQSDSGGWGREW